MSRVYVGKCYDCRKRIHLKDGNELYKKCDHKFTSITKKLSYNDVHGIELQLRREDSHLGIFPDKDTQIFLIDDEAEQFETEFQEEHKRLKTKEYTKWRDKHRDRGDLMENNILKLTLFADNMYFTQISLSDDPAVLNKRLELIAKIFWSLIHEDIREVSKSRFEAGFYSDAVLEAFKKVDRKVQELYIAFHKAKKGTDAEDIFGKNLMETAFDEKDPIIQLSDITKRTGKNIQKGFKNIFMGSIQAIRNEFAHELFTELITSRNEAIGLIFFASRLLSILEIAE